MLNKKTKMKNIVKIFIGITTMALVACGGSGEKSNEKSSLKGNVKENTIRTFNSGCNLVLHCNANYKEMEIIGKNSPLVSKFIIKKTSQFYKVLS